MSAPVQIKEWTVFASQGKMTFQEDASVIDEKKGLFVVVDGFGGRAGMQFARESCDSVKRFLLREARDEEATLPFLFRTYLSLAGNVLFNAMVFANRALLKKNRAVHIHQRGGASVLAGYLDDDLLALANLGNCSIFLYRDGKKMELVKPRSYQALRDPFSPHRSFGVPLTALGISEDMEPEIVEVKVRRGDWLLVFTDGIRQTHLETVWTYLGQAPEGRAGHGGLDQLQRQLSALDYEDNAHLALIRLE